MKFDRNYWDQRYIDDNTGWDIGEVSTPLKAYIDQLENVNLKILIPGCGNAHEAEYLYKKGFINVFLIDLSPTALNHFKKRVQGFDDNHLICSDFFDHYDKYDIVIEQTFFCAIDPCLRERYAQHVSEILLPNGKLTGLLFNDVLNADHPPFGGSKKEYLTYFEPYFNIEIMEEAYNSISPRKNRELFIKLIKK